MKLVYLIISLHNAEAMRQIMEGGQDHEYQSNWLVRNPESNLAPSPALRVGPRRSVR